MSEKEKRTITPYEKADLADVAKELSYLKANVKELETAIISLSETINGLQTNLSSEIEKKTNRIYYYLKEIENKYLTGTLKLIATLQIIMIFLLILIAILK